MYKFKLDLIKGIAAYLGYLNKYDIIEESILDLNIRQVVSGAMKESGDVLIKKYGFNRDKHEKYIEKILSRFSNPYLKDDITRKARQTLRKLDNNDRLIKPLRGTIEYNLKNDNLIKGIAAALSYDYFGDEEAVRMQNILTQNEVEEGIFKITGLDKNSKEVKLIKDEYLKINPRARK